MNDPGSQTSRMKHDSVNRLKLPERFLQGRRGHPESLFKFVVRGATAGAEEGLYDLVMQLGSRSGSI